ncbi:isomerase [Streptomyces sp. DSM 42041]|uniref:Isomerase n=1 Tax=Streptomyces hazeniae TaxID=3075538 RepID=A0ABU2NKC2_9ACTN|nr:isomerase [Streptomyces sp. DSM 42041]MDT0377441.1 isomerase [Streptomyces sp. DSM 42041]
MTRTTTDPTPAPLTDAVARYLRFWNAPPGQQEQLGADVFADDVTSVTPVGIRTGVGELAAFARHFREEAGAYELRARTEPDTHHDRARLRWELVVGGASFAEGTDVLVVDASGRIASVTAFLDRAPEGFDARAHAEEAS